MSAQFYGLLGPNAGNIIGSSLDSIGDDKQKSAFDYSKLLALGAQLSANQGLNDYRKASLVQQAPYVQAQTEAQIAQAALNRGKLEAQQNLDPNDPASIIRYKSINGQSVDNEINLMAKIQQADKFGADFGLDDNSRNQLIQSVRAGKDPTESLLPVLTTKFGDGYQQIVAGINKAITQSPYTNNGKPISNLEAVQLGNSYIQSLVEDPKLGPVAKALVQYSNLLGKTPINIIDNIGALADKYAETAGKVYTQEQSNERTKVLAPLRERTVQQGQDRVTIAKEDATYKKQKDAEDAARKELQDTNKGIKDEYDALVKARQEEIKALQGQLKTEIKPSNKAKIQQKLENRTKNLPKLKVGPGGKYQISDPQSEANKANEAKFNQLMELLRRAK